ncbi:MAG: hypothetical protein BYD32DRAFT_411987 [Podila humilis]|nr:MAG: hypothetical protein BYD32DRAFT_411987 [Podila humilis]
MVGWLDGRMAATPVLLFVFVAPLLSFRKQHHQNDAPMNRYEQHRRTSTRHRKNEVDELFILRTIVYTHHWEITLPSI